MKVGDKVILSAIGMDRYVDQPSNPHNTLGVISYDYGYDGFVCYVVWCNGKANVYVGEDLQVIQC